MRLIIENDKIIIDDNEYVPVGEKSEIKVGDLVRVTDRKFYSNYYTWAGWKEAPIEYAIKYQYFGGVPHEEENCVVRYIGCHGKEDKKLAIIEDTLCGRCYLVNVKGLKKVKEGNEQ